MKKHYQISLFLSLFALSTAFAQQAKEILYVGTYSVRDSKGLYVFEFNRLKGTLKLIQTIEDAESPNFIEIHPNGQYLYTVNSGAISANENGGSVTAYTIDPKTGKLSFLNHVSSQGKGPCHVSIDKTGEWVFISNYVEGNFVVFPILQDGSLGAAFDAKKYTGSGPNEERQEQPHIHSATLSANNKFIYVADLGTDNIYTYSIDLKAGKINPATPPATTVAPGAGPRHIAFHPTGKYAYAVEELTSTVAAFNVNTGTGALTMMQDTVRSLPKVFKEFNKAADIHTDPQGKFLYMSNRGHDALAIYSIGKTGKIKLAGFQKTLGKNPRNFLVDPKGKYVLVANQDSDNIVIFKTNPKTGLLTYTRNQAKVPSPVCLKLKTLGAVKK